MASGTNPQGRLIRLLCAVGALIVLVAVVAGIPILMATVHMVPHGIPSFHQLGQGIKQRDNGQLAAVVIAVGIWICWVLFTLSLIPEIAAAARKRPSHPLPWLAAFQRPAGSLVAAIAIGFTLAPLITGITASRADPAPPSLPSSPPVVSISATAVPQARAAQQHDQRTGPGLRTDDSTAKPADATAPTYQVQPRDTLWKIAEDHLDDPMRYTEIVKLNAHLIGPDNEIATGTVLVMPADATGLPSAPTQDAAAPTKTTHVHVEQSDTLWSIEQRLTGSGSGWHAGWDANKDRVEPGGEHFTDPNLIKPGWVLDIPSSASSTTAPPNVQRGTAPQTGAPHTATPGGSHGVPVTPRHPSTPPGPRSTPEAPGSASTPAQATHTPAHRDTHRAQAASEKRYLSLEVGGGLLAATTFAALMIHRHRKFRHRRPGHVVASLPPELVPLEQALVAGGRAALAKMTFLDLALRDLAARVSRQPAGLLPDIVGAGINDDYLELYLAGDAGQPPEPWVATDTLRWTLGRSAELDAVAGRRLAPYPCLVSIGYSEDGTEYLLDLEHVGALQLVGDPARCLDLARYVVAELANNVWSDHLTVTVAGFGQELIAANPNRLAHTDDPHAAATVLSKVAAENRAVAGSAGVDVLEGRLRGTAGDVWMPHVLLAAPGLLEEDTDLVRTAAGRGRAAVAVVLSGGLDVGVGSRVQVTSGGSLVIALLPIADVTAFGLPLADAADVAQAIALDRDGTLDEPTPRSSGDRPWDAFTDAAGALLREFTVPRASSGPAAIDPAAAVNSSVLPGPDEAYLAATATTEDDLAELAPAVTAETRVAVEKADPELDELVAAWKDPEAKLAKLQVLGPVTVTAYGRPPAKQEDFCTEIVHYLWSKPNGVSTDQFANDLWPRKNYTGTDSYPKDMASRVRHWLGIDPRTGTEYWPRARRGGVQGYSICGLLVDYDLFRRLRVRGEARGADGLPDLVTALDLVSGTPLSHLREFGYGWLPAGDELLYQGSIAEVAHLVATRSLEAGDNAEAIRACEIALQFDAEDDRALLGIIKAHENAGREAEKQATILRLTALEDPPARTLEVMRRNGWLVRGA